MISDSNYAVLLAGGEGTRFAPLSTPEKPKQFLSFFSDASFLQLASLRLGGLVSLDHLYVMTAERYRPLVAAQLPDLPAANIICEPQKKNTAPAIAYITKLIAQRDPRATVAVFPSDAMIETREQFQDAIRLALTVSREDRRIVMVGIEPRFASSEYGYLQCGLPLRAYGSAAYEVQAFTEKPPEELAQAYLAAGSYLWNGGIFIFPASLLLQEVERYIPKLGALLAGFQATDDFRRDYFAQAEAVSIDHGLMEKCSRLALIRANFEWSDIGTWKGLKEFVHRTRIALRKEVLAVMTEQVSFQKETS